MEKDVLNPLTWSKEQWKDALLTGAAEAFILLFGFLTIYIFY